LILKPTQSIKLRVYGLVLVLTRYYVVVGELVVAVVAFLELVVGVVQHLPLHRLEGEEQYN
jgi:hypothetical protein